MHVLLADDDRVTVQWLSGVLTGAGHRVTVAHDSVQALMQAKRVVPDAIVLDIGMPGGSGELVLGRLKTSTKTSAIPVIVLTALRDPALPRRVRELGAEEFLVKPTTPDAVTKALERVAGPPSPGEAA